MSKDIDREEKVNYVLINYLYQLSILNFFKVR